jgi:cytochrome c-type biogenesis protein
VGVASLAGISILELIVGVLLIGIGAGMLSGWEPPTPTVQLPSRRRSSSGYFGFGILYAAAAAGCTAPIFIAVALKALSVSPTLSFVTFGAYAAGMSLLMMGLTILAALGRDTALTWFSGRTELIYRAAGGLLILAGIVQIYFFLFRFDGLRVLGL